MTTANARYLAIAGCSVFLSSQGLRRLESKNLQGFARPEPAYPFLSLEVS